MTDIYTKEPLRVLVDPMGSGPYMRVHLDQLDAIIKVLEAHKVRHWAEEYAFSVGGEARGGCHQPGEE